MAQVRPCNTLRSLQMCFASIPKVVSMPSLPASSTGYHIHTVQGELHQCQYQNLLDSADSHPLWSVVFWNPSRGIVKMSGEHVLYTFL